MLHQHCICILKAHVFWIIVRRWAYKAPRTWDWDYLRYFLLRSLFPACTVAAAQRSLCACRPSSHGGAAINSAELLSRLNSAGSAPSCKLELRRALQPPYCHVKGNGRQSHHEPPCFHLLSHTRGQTGSGWRLPVSLCGWKAGERL